MRPRNERNIENVPHTKNIYEGAANGQLKFPNYGQGYGIRFAKTDSLMDMGKSTPAELILLMLL